MSELEYLSVKQLKNLLSTNRVDYKGCIERQELLNRVSRLWQEYKQSRQGKDKYINVCVIIHVSPFWVTLKNSTHCHK